MTSQVHLGFVIGFPEDARELAPDHGVNLRGERMGDALF